MSAKLDLFDLGVTVTVSRSGGIDDAVVIDVDTAWEPDGSDGGPGLRISVNDDYAYKGVEYIPEV